MNTRIVRSSKRSESGFTLIELLVVVLIIGILAAIAVPQYFKVIEKGRSAEAVTWIGTLKEAQERYYLKNGTYTTAPSLLDVSLGTPKNFNAPSFGTGANQYTVSMSRNASPAVYGSYTVSMRFSQNGAATWNGKTVCNQSNCQTDLMP